MDPASHRLLLTPGSRIPFLERTSLYKKKGEKQQQPFKSSMINSEEKKAIFHIFASCDQMNYPLNTCTVQMVVKQVKRHFAKSDRLIDVNQDVCVRLLSEYRKMK